MEDYAFLGDLHTAALVGRDGSVDWLCLPRFDSPACFAALLDDETAGRWLLAPAAGGPATRRGYRGDALILDSEWDTPDGTVRVTDFMPPRGESADVIRIVTGVTGRVPMRMQLRLRFDYGHVVPWVRRVGERLVAVAGPDAVSLTTPVELTGHDQITTAEFDVAAGQSVPFVLTHSLSWQQHPRPVDPARALADTEAFWAGWVAGCTYRGSYAPAVRRSLVLLKALTYAPTGGIVAAATTSLPEQLGGPRNWDYRYCWLRDATFTLQALLGTGYVAEASAWREWLVRAVAGDPADLQIMYGVDGLRRLPEYELHWLRGYGGATPVRVGNAAAGQFQLDVWGEVLTGLHEGRRAGLPESDPAWDLQRALLDYLEGHWSDPDDSLWEMRGQRRHFVHSKVLAWAGLDRAVQAVETFGLPGPAEAWRTTRAQIHADVLANGYDRDRKHFHPVLRQQRPRRRPPAHPRDRVPPPLRPPGPGHHRRRPTRAHRQRPAAALPTRRRRRRRPARRRRLLPRLQLLARRRPARRRAARPGGRPVRAPSQPAQRPRHPRRGIRHRRPPASRQRPPSLQPRRPRQHRPTPHRPQRPHRRHPHPARVAPREPAHPASGRWPRAAVPVW